jgi:hypothetical protein
VDPTVLKLTNMDDIIYADFRKEFPDFTVEIIKEDQLKTAESKEVCTMQSFWFLAHLS